MEETQGNLLSGSRMDRSRGHTALSTGARVSDLPEPPHGSDLLGFHIRRNPKNGPMWCSNAHQEQTDDMLTDSRCTEEEWEIPISDRYALPEFASDSTEIQNGRAGIFSENHRAGRFYVHDRPSGRLLSYKHERRNANLPGFPMEGRILRIFFFFFFFKHFYL